MVNSKEEAIAAVRSCKYPPEGNRSAAGMRGDWGEFKRGDYREYTSTVNKGVLVLPMIETEVKTLTNLSREDSGYSPCRGINGPPPASKTL